MCTLQNADTAAQCVACGSPRTPAGSGGAACGAGGSDQATPDFVIPAGKTSIYLCAKSLDVALANCALCVEAAQRACVSRTPAFALVRPPGHHASAESSGSYCLLNTAGVTARAVLASGGGRCTHGRWGGGGGGGGSGDEGMMFTGTDKGEGVVSRVLVVDWDVHHGDGTQALVTNDAVLRAGCTFVSIHRHDDGFWPTSGSVGDGGENVVNVPLRGTGFGDADYYYVFEHVVVPLAAQLKPDLVLVSAGYDCASGDMLGRFEVSARGFRSLTRLSLGLAGGAALLVLEGGYDVDGTSGHAPLVGGVCASVDGMLCGAMGLDDLPCGWRSNVRPETQRVVEEVKAAMS